VPTYDPRDAYNYDWTINGFCHGLWFLSRRLLALCLGSLGVYNLLSVDNGVTPTLGAITSRRDTDGMHRIHWCIQHKKMSPSCGCQRACPLSHFHPQNFRSTIDNRGSPTPGAASLAVTQQASYQLMSSAQENDRRLWPLMTPLLHKLRMPRTDNEASTPGSAITQLACEGTKNVTRVSPGMLFLFSNLAAAGIFLLPTRESVSDYPGQGMFPFLSWSANSCGDGLDHYSSRTMSDRLLIMDKVMSK
jgi:hypothetical protein